MLFSCLNYWQSEKCDVKPNADFEITELKDRKINYKKYIYDVIQKINLKNLSLAKKLLNIKIILIYLMGKLVKKP